MSDETWLNAKKAVELGFADEILFEDKPESTKQAEQEEEETEKPDEETEEPNEEEEQKQGGDDSGEKKPIKLEDTVWQFSSRLMGETILNRLEAKYPPEPPADEPQAGAEAQEQCEEELRAPTDDEPKVPVIGMDGKTEDGAMPYEILKNQLALLR